MIGPGSLDGGRECYGYGSTRILLSYPIKMKPQDYAIRMEVRSRTMNISLFSFSSRCGNRPVMGLWSMHYNLRARGSLFSANRPDNPCIFFSFSLFLFCTFWLCVLLCFWSIVVWTIFQSRRNIWFDEHGSRTLNNMHLFVMILSCKHWDYIKEYMEEERDPCEIL